MVSFLGKFAAWLLSDPVAEKRATPLLEQREAKFRDEMRKLIAEGLEKQQPAKPMTATQAYHARRVEEAQAKRTLPPSPVVKDYERAKQEAIVQQAAQPQGMDVLTTMLVVNALVDSSPASVPDCSSDYSSSCGDSFCSSSDFSSSSCDSGSF